jgi:hypothetical protein
LPVAYFLTCLTLAKPTEENRRKASRFLYPLRSDVPEVVPVDTGPFGGILDYDKLSELRWVKALLGKEVARKGARRRLNHGCEPHNALAEAQSAEALEKPIN